MSHPGSNRCNFETKTVFKKFHFALLLFVFFGRITGFEILFTIVAGSHETFDGITVIRPSHTDFYQVSLNRWVARIVLDTWFMSEVQSLIMEGVNVG